DLPEALRTNCEKCSDRQKKMVRKAANYLIKEKPNDWEKIAKKYDPDHQYSAQFRKFLKEE
ncbi:hypothetical protein L9F63_020428, partial [Diploptera punctata]